MLQFSKKNASEICLKTVAKNDPNIEPILMQNGAKMGPKRHQKINVFLGRFADASGNIDLFAAGPRLSRECHTFSSRPPRAAAYYQRILYKNKQRQHSLPDLARLGPLARRIFVDASSGCG